MSIPKEHKIIAVAQLITVAGLVCLWALHVFDSAPEQASDSYRFLFDKASPLPDCILGVFLCLSAYLLLRGVDQGRMPAMVSALYLVYLGALDVGFPFKGAVYAISIIDISSNGVVNLWCVVMGLYAIIKLRKQKQTSQS